MKQQMIFILSILSICAFCQSKPDTIRSDYEFPMEETPVFPGGMKALTEFIKTNIKYPPVILEKGIYGTSYAQFTIDTAGNVKDAKIIKGIKECPECDTETMRLLSIMPKWKPAFVNGKYISTKINLPFKYRTQ